MLAYFAAFRPCQTMERAIGEAEQHDAYLKGRHATYLDRQLAAFARGTAKMPELPIVVSDASLR